MSNSRMNPNDLTADDLYALPTHSVVACEESYGRCYVAIKHAEKWAVSGHRDRMTSEELFQLSEGREVIQLLKMGHEH